MAGAEAPKTVCEAQEALAASEPRPRRSRAIPPTPAIWKIAFRAEMTTIPPRKGVAMAFKDLEEELEALQIPSTFDALLAAEPRVAVMLEAERARNREYRRAWKMTPAGKEASRRWRNSPAGKAARKRYRESAAGRASAKRSRERYRKKRRERLATDPKFRTADLAKRARYNDERRERRAAERPRRPPVGLSVRSIRGAVAAGGPTISEMWQIPLWPEQWAAVALGLSEKDLRAFRSTGALPVAMLGAKAYYLRDSLLACFVEGENRPAGRPAR